MHTISSRVSNVSAFLSSCVMGLVLAVAVTSALYQMYQTPPAGELAVTNLKVLPGKGRYSRKYGTRQQEFAFVNLNLTADLSPLFHWNTKQLFLYVSAEYTDQQGPKDGSTAWFFIFSSDHGPPSFPIPAEPELRGVKLRLLNQRAMVTSDKVIVWSVGNTVNDVVIWDRIVRRKEDANISSNIHNKYRFKAMSPTFQNVPPAQYTLKYNVMPYIGMLAWGEAARTSEPIPFPEAHQLS